MIDLSKRKPTKEIVWSDGTKGAFYKSGYNLGNHTYSSDIEAKGFKVLPDKLKELKQQRLIIKVDGTIYLPDVETVPLYPDIQYYYYKNDRSNIHNTSNNIK